MNLLSNFFEIYFIFVENQEKCALKCIIIKISENGNPLIITSGRNSLRKFEVDEFLAIEEIFD